MKLNIHDLVALLEELPEQKLRRGDVGSVFKASLPDGRYEIRFGASHERGMISATLAASALVRLNQAYDESLSPFAPLASHSEYEAQCLEEIQAVQTKSDIHIPPDLSLHDRLHLVCVHRPTDFAPYGIRLRDSADCSCGCRHFVPLAGQEGADWGVCANPRSPRAGLLTFEHQGCEFFADDSAPQPE
jgi:hypothetical protein